jgi:tRNA pseudouridine38-40 synthase
MSISYVGTAYCGFQSQPGLTTVQGVLEEALRVLTGEEIQVQASGRTDAGVHAREQVISFHTASRIPIERWSLALSSRLPADISAFRAYEAPMDFHARFSAKRKTYRYSIQRSRFVNVFHRNTRFHHPMPLDVSAMAAAAKHLEGEHSFTSFCSVKTAVGSHVRTIYEAGVAFEPEECPGDSSAGVIHIQLTGNGFLYNMVRIIAGTLIEVGEGKRHADDIPGILQACNRAAAGPTAMAHGLTLWSVSY